MTESSTPYDRNLSILRHFTVSDLGVRKPGLQNQIPPLLSPKSCFRNAYNARSTDTGIQESSHSFQGLLQKHKHTSQILFSSDLIINLELQRKTDCASSSSRYTMAPMMPRLILSYMLSLRDQTLTGFGHFGC